MYSMEAGDADTRKFWKHIGLGKLLCLYSFQLWSHDRGSGFSKQLDFIELALPRSEIVIHRSIGVVKNWPGVNGRRLPSHSCTCTPGMCSVMTSRAFIRISFWERNRRSYVQSLLRKAACQWMAMIEHCRLPIVHTTTFSFVLTSISANDR